METLWSKGPSSIRELLEAFPKDERLTYTTVQTVVDRLESKRAIRRTSKFGNAHVFEAVVSCDSAPHRMIDDLVLVGGLVGRHSMVPPAPWLNLRYVLPGSAPAVEDRE